jgi:hypothetical protein
MTFCGSRRDPGGAIPPWRSEFQIADCRFHLWNLAFAIPKGMPSIRKGYAAIGIAPRINRAGNRAGDDVLPQPTPSALPDIGFVPLIAATPNGTATLSAD